MPCEHIAGAIVCSRGRRGRCAYCHLAGGLLCDWKMGNGGLCNKPLCPEHGKEVAPNKHLCPEHQQALEAWKKRKEPREPCPGD